MFNKVTDFEKMRRGFMGVRHMLLAHGIGVSGLFRVTRQEVGRPAVLVAQQRGFNRGEVETEFACPWRANAGNYFPHYQCSQRPRAIHWQMANQPRKVSERTGRSRNNVLFRCCCRRFFAIRIRHGAKIGQKAVCVNGVEISRGSETQSGQKNGAKLALGPAK
jgi:hypothetical protein